MKSFAAILVFILLIGAGFFYRDALAQTIAGFFPDQTIPPTPQLALASPTPSPSPLPSASPTPAPTASPLESIADLNGKPLPTAGPEFDMILVGGLSSLTGVGLYYRRLRKDLKESWKKIDIR